ncbi:DUF402 domain-containing protein [Streptomyces sp. NPDC001568]|uniref:DUF402 domain-containing protein n=1 Tax=Streptomyces sp. NPDC001568 TaxID=3364588 RepID=UPI0036D0E6A0
MEGAGGLVRHQRLLCPGRERRQLRNWYVNFEHPTRRTPAGFDTFDLTVDLLVTPDLTGWEWKDADEYAYVRRLGIVSDTEHQAVNTSRRCSGPVQPQEQTAPSWPRC